MLHIIKYHFLALIRNKMLIFWTMLFPILLSTFINMTVMQQIDEGLKVIPIAVIDNEQYEDDQIFKEVINIVSSGENALFAVQYIDQNTADNMLKSDEIDGYYMHEDGDITLHVDEKDMYQLVMKSFIDEFKHKSYMVQELMMNGAQSNQVMALFDETTSYINEQGQSENTNVGITTMYSILAMTMLYGGYFILHTSHNQMADRCEVAKRNNIAPTKRSIQLFADFIVTITIHILIQLVLLLYMKFILEIEFGANFMAVLVVIIIGSFAGNAFGLLVSMYGTKSYEANTGILTGVTMLCCTLSGMMMVEIKYYIQLYVPILAQINPATMIVDALYAEYYYGFGERYLMNILYLLIFTSACYALAYVRLRRKQYVNL